MIEIKNLHKWFAKDHVLQGINLSVAKGEKIVICGPSGSGKSTFIRCLNRLENYEQGSVIIDGVEFQENPRDLEILRMKVGMVFQHFNLFSHLSVQENLILAPQLVKKISRHQALELAKKNLERVKILDHAHKFPSQLSGGQKQRVAIARALCMGPEMMLFDEPTSALDAEMVKEVLDVLRELATEGMTMMIVTHELNFAREIADRIVFMDEGKILEVATPEEFFSNPKTLRAQQFLSQVL